MSEITQPTRRLDRFQTVRTRPVRRRRGTRLWLLALAALFLIYFLAPLGTNILLLGTDDSPERGAVGRTDTIILTTVVPLKTRGMSLRRSRHDRMLAGVCGGLAEFSGVNPFWFRLGFLIALLPGGVPGIAAYLILWLVVPSD